MIPAAVTTRTSATTRRSSSRRRRRRLRNSVVAFGLVASVVPAAAAVAATTALLGCFWSGGGPAAFVVVAAAFSVVRPPTAMKTSRGLARWRPPLPVAPRRGNDEGFFRSLFYRDPRHPNVEEPGIATKATTSNRTRTVPNGSDVVVGDGAASLTAKRESAPATPTTKTTTETIRVPSYNKDLIYDVNSGRFYESSGSGSGDDHQNTGVVFPLGTIYDRTLDTVEDAIVHARRIPYDWGWIDESKAAGADDDKLETVVVLGSGWAAHALLKVADTYKLRIVVVSPTNHFVFTPSTFTVERTSENCARDTVVAISLFRITKKCWMIYLTPCSLSSFCTFVYEIDLEQCSHRPPSERWNTGP